MSPPHIKRRTLTHSPPSGASADVQGCINVVMPWMAKSDHCCALWLYERMELVRPQRYLCYFLKFITRQQKARGFRIGLFRIRNLAMSYSHMGTPTLPSALLRFTSEFGMESGGTTALLSLDKKVTISKAFRTLFFINTV